MSVIAGRKVPLASSCTSANDSTRCVASMPSIWLVMSVSGTSQVRPVLVAVATPMNMAR